MTTVNAVNTYIVPTTANEVTMPLQPSFSAFSDALRQNVTGDGTIYIVQFNDDSGGGFFDQNLDFNTGTYRFTAPVTGVYLLNTLVVCSEIAVAHTDGALYFNINGTRWPINLKNPANCEGTGGFLSFGGNLIVELTATWVVYVEIQISNGLLAIDIQAGNQTRFAGSLIA